MKRVLALITLTAMLAGASTAQADKQYTTTCGGSGIAKAPSWPFSAANGHITPQLNWEQNCGDGKTIEVELQHNTPANPNIWTDVPGNDFQFSTPSNYANRLVIRHSISPNPMDCTHHDWFYRIHVWWSDGDDPGGSVNGPDC